MSYEATQPDARAMTTQHLETPIIGAWPGPALAPHQHRAEEGVCDADDCRAGAELYCKVREMALPVLLIVG
jgi:hypothetical protein